ncbi:DUF3152 domain-containing protein [Luteococcus sp. Sow4_B9]|uniref:DUF3152 domain-containing protein n=1 Tax=Luteococcus sp. Sow4_B9 TaxID=3438792 RepID=UPI003F98C3DC
MTEPPWKRPAVRLTPRGRRVASIAVLVIAAAVALALIGSLLRGCGSTGSDGQDSAAPGPEPSQSPTATPTARTTPTPSRVTTPSPRPGPSADADGLVRTGLKGKGTWQVAPLVAPPRKQTARVHRYVVKVEDGTGLDVTTTAKQVAAVLNDPRGWSGREGHSFELVKDPAKANFAILLASPGTVQKMCPLDVRMTWSCQAGTNVLLNSDRWLYMTPTYSDLTAYRAYLVNHEVGHFIGKGHVGCPAPGRNAPVMMQQSKRIDGCKPNPWPSGDGK